MRIVHVIARLNDGGPARVIAALGRGMAQLGHRVSVLSGDCGTDEPDLTAAVRAEGVEVERVAGFQRSVGVGGDVGVLRSLLARLRASHPDVVHTHTAKAGVLGRIACRRLRLPCLHTYHGHVLHGYFSPAGSAVVRAIERGVAGNAWHHALTASQARDLRDRAGIGRRRRWVVLPIPVAPVAKREARWHAQLVPGVPVVGFLGRLAAVKDARLYLDALATLARDRQVQGVMCGDGQQRAELERHARTLGVPVLFTGFVPAGEAFGAMDVLLMSSRNEGLPLVVVEAATAGVPVVAPAVGGLADVIAAGGALGARRTAVALAAGCARLLDDPRTRDALLATARASASSAMLEALAPRYERLYRLVMDRHA